MALKPGSNVPVSFQENNPCILSIDFHLFKLSQQSFQVKNLESEMMITFGQ